jgi:hypothetical protein
MDLGWDLVLGFLDFGAILIQILIQIRIQILVHILVFGRRVDFLE